MLDIQSLLIVLLVTGLCLGVTMLGVWRAVRSDGSMLTFGLGILMLVAHVSSFLAYSQTASPWACAAALVTLPPGFALFYHSSACYFGGARSIARSAALPGASALATTALTLYGLDGAGFIVAYGVTVAILVAMAAYTWKNRAAAPTLLIGASLLWGLLAASFALCAIVLLAGRQWSIGTAPDNWAEQLNTMVAAICTLGMGGLSVALHYVEDAARHRADASTDPLTGLANRRALVAELDRLPFDERTALIMFDLDHFKRINDVFGHAFGDEVLRRFADIVRQAKGVGDFAARLGGEEFVLVAPRAADANGIAHRVVQSFASQSFETPLGPVRATASAGVAIGAPQGLSLSEMLSRADAALYAAKHDGRNRVRGGDLQLAS